MAVPAANCEWALSLPGGPMYIRMERKGPDRTEKEDQHKGSDGRASPSARTRLALAVIFPLSVFTHTTKRFSLLCLLPSQVIQVTKDMNCHPLCE